MKVTVIIPCYNAGIYLARAVSSVRDQEAGFPLTTEIIVIDDGSTDGSVEKLERAFATEPSGSNLKILHQDHRGASAARNYGMKEATGECILFLDADDVLVSNAIDSLYQGLLQNGGGHQVALGMAEEFISEELDSKTAGELTKKEVPFGAFLSGCCFGKKEALLKVGYFDPNLKSGGETVDWLARLRYSGLKTVQLNVITVRRRIHLTNTGRVLMQGQMQDYASIIRKRLLAQRMSNKN